MARLTRAQQQQRTRAAVLVAARAEFAAHGYAAAKVDRIAERAELTRGAVYSNFAGKRALYLAVLCDAAERELASAAPPAAPPGSREQALNAFARVWLERLPLAGDSPHHGHLQLRSLTPVIEDDAARTALAQLVRFEALLLALAVEGDRTVPPHAVRVAELALTLLYGAASLAEQAPGAGDPFELARAAGHLAALPAGGADLGPAHLPYVAPARPAAEPWTAPRGLRDGIGGGPLDAGADGVLVVLGAGRLAAAEEALRAARPGESVTVVVVSGDPAGTGALVRLRVTDLAGCLRRVFPAAGLPLPRLVHDPDGAVPAALGLRSPAGDGTEFAVRLRDGLITARAEGRGAGHAAAVHGVRDRS
ncbi:TetR/AcrR family transcriptional regulator [Streptomyces sp. AA0539]|uniref:TetR/AcrR family transcriptional regulator n=1 Tax=Streptomyces sp. AA0539 TaxID=1210045 RepID=UPI0002EE0A2E|nr:TetR/AcrR family transcriptional regulator [Streptomyces sp. AA0539]